MEPPVLHAPTLSNVHFVGGEKGGVGKSMLSRLLAQYFIDHELPFTGFDTNRSHATLPRFYGKYAQPALVGRFEALDRIVEVAIEQPGRRVLMDLAAHGQGFTLQFSLFGPGGLPRRRVGAAQQGLLRCPRLARVQPAWRH